MSEQGWKYISAQCMFSNVDHFAISHDSPFWVLVQMLKQRMLQTWEGEFSIFTDKNIENSKI